MINMHKDVEGDRKSVRNFKRAVVWCDTAVAADFASPLSRLPNIKVSNTGSSRYRSGRFFMASMSGSLRATRVVPRNLSPSLN